MKPCPFCGHDIVKLDSWPVNDHTEYAGVCQNCGAQGPSDLGVSGAMEMWELRRPEEILLQEHRAAMIAEGAACDQRLKLERALRDELAMRLDSVIGNMVQDVEFLHVLASQRADLAAALRASELVVPPYGGEPFYPCCNRYAWEGHRPTCQRQAALARLETNDA